MGLALQPAGTIHPRKLGSRSGVAEASAGAHPAHSREKTGPAPAAWSQAFLLVTQAHTQETGLRGHNQIRRQTGPGPICPTLLVSPSLLPAARPGWGAQCWASLPRPTPALETAGRTGSQGGPRALPGVGKQGSADSDGGRGVVGNVEVTSNVPPHSLDPGGGIGSMAGQGTSWGIQGVCVHFLALLTLMPTPQHCSVFYPFHSLANLPEQGTAQGAEEGRGPWVFCSGSSSEA